MISSSRTPVGHRRRSKDSSRVFKFTAAPENRCRDREELVADYQIVSPPPESMRMSPAYLSRV
jgi:hypothetical protein